MVRAIITWSLHNRLIVLLGTLMLVIAGLYSARNLNVEAYPDPTPPLVEVIAQNPGASPEEMERLVGIPIEIALNGMPGLEDLRSTSIAGLTDVKCQFTYNTDYWKARQEVINRINALNNLPPGVNPGLSPWSPTGEIVRYVLEGPGLHVERAQGGSRLGAPARLKTVPGVIDVTGFGGTVKQYQVLVDPMQLNHYGITLQQVQDAIQKSNANVGGNILTLGSQSHIVRGIGLLGKGIDPLEPETVAHRAEYIDQKLDDIRNVVVTQYQGNPILVSHVAKVVEGHQPRLGIVGRHNRHASRKTMSSKASCSCGSTKNRSSTSELVKEKLEDIDKQKILPAGNADQDLQRAHRAGPRDDPQRAAQPAGRHGTGDRHSLHFPGRPGERGHRGDHDPAGACLFSITVLYVQGKSANLLSIGAVDFGIIVDSSTIIVENIYRHVTAPGVDRSRSLIDRIIEASSEIERALLYSTTIIVCAFIPLSRCRGRRALFLARWPIPMRSRSAAPC